MRLLMAFVLAGLSLPRTAEVFSFRELDGAGRLTQRLPRTHAISHPNPASPYH